MEAWLAEAVAGGPEAGGATIVARDQIKDYRLQFVSLSWKRFELTNLGHEGYALSEAASGLGLQVKR
jgi:hypothetical protein